ncbi:MAG: twin-arginine translocation signal domain-containing protein [Deltaproteobacteria bacterium]|nr:MAG: twin-arginine translocation signal domain-containing protein [Deltaproteobacteria bacterium]
MSTTRRQFLTRTSATALVAASGLVSLPNAVAATAEPLAPVRTFRVRPDEVHALIARLEERSGAPIGTRGNLLFVPAPGGPYAVRLELVL